MQTPLPVMRNKANLLLTVLSLNTKPTIGVHVIADDIDRLAGLYRLLLLFLKIEHNHFFKNESVYITH